MEFKEAKNKFVQTWGALGSQWGINKTMAQIHALLMVSHEPVLPKVKYRLLLSK
jgi:DNA-binding transcriptional regulator GbsR (MarR family)